MMDRKTFQGATAKTQRAYLFDEIQELKGQVCKKLRFDRYTAIVCGALGGVGAMAIFTGKITWETIKSLFF